MRHDIPSTPRKDHEQLINNGPKTRSINVQIGRNPTGIESKPELWNQNEACLPEGTFHHVIIQYIQLNEHIFIIRGH